MITSLQHPLVKKVCLLKKSRKERYQERLVVVEGNNLLDELLVQLEVETLLIKEGFSPPPSWLLIPHRIVTDAVMRKMSDCEESPGALAVFSMPEKELPESPNRLLILGGISDPGNLGTLLRSALAFGWDGVLLLEGCCDPFNPKAIRAAKGATFHLPLKQGTFSDRPEAGTLFIADLEGTPYREVVFKGAIQLLLGNEAHGVSNDWNNGKKITIPLELKMESLNVAIAGSIMMENFRG